ncbi:hypothetical protein EYR36_006232 [Pleurotus pulmonarius]|nr:hypothetical protein EYR36_006232 [Pleurotus pulmonarius]KAF4600939.1 hypothetical protein EYR38_005585 [Pleurotus pulmonarius]
MTSVPPQRAPKRVAMACTYCRRRKIKCEPQTSPNYSCKNCSDRRQQCTYLPVEFDDPNAPQLQQSLSPSPEAPYFPTASSHTSMQYPGHPQDNLWPQQSQQMQQAYTQQRGMPGYTMPGDGGRYASSDDLLVCTIDALVGLTTAQCPTPQRMDTTRVGIHSMAKVSLYLTAEAIRHSRTPHRQRTGSITLAPPGITLTLRPTLGASLQRHQCKSLVTLCSTILSEFQVLPMHSGVPVRVLPRLRLHLPSSSCLMVYSIMVSFIYAVVILPT